MFSERNWNVCQVFGSNNNLFKEFGWVVRARQFRSFWRPSLQQNERHPIYPDLITAVCAHRGRLIPKSSSVAAGLVMLAGLIPTPSSIDMYDSMSMQMVTRPRLSTLRGHLPPKIIHPAESSCRSSAIRECNALASSRISVCDSSGFRDEYKMTPCPAGP
jgi:hypothetical protein